MWVFGYGSLMWDNWEQPFGCLAKVKATLSNYRRTFNKASIRNWGTHERPGPTLNLESATKANCIGFAFQFPEERELDVWACLKQREGGFDFDRVVAQLEDGRTVEVVTPIYRGQNLIEGKSLNEIAAMVRQAHGTSGSCSDYVTNLAAMLESLSINDASVAQLSAELAHGGSRNAPIS